MAPRKREASEESEEFEVEKILQHKGKPNKRMYLVAWVGYPASENSWAEEENLESCKTLLDEYWKKHSEKEETKKKAPVSNTSAASKKRKAPEGSSRGRKRVKEDSSDGSAQAKVNGVGNQQQESASDSGEDGVDAPEHDMAKYMKFLDWEPLVSTVITVEPDPSTGGMRLFVTWEDGSRAWVASDLLYTRAPQKCLAFYEAHLKFKSSN